MTKTARHRLLIPIILTGFACLAGLTLVLSQAPDTTQADILQSQLNNMTADRDRLQARADRLQDELTEMVCLNQSIYDWTPVDIALSEDMQRYAAAIAHTYGIPPAMLFAVGEQESRWTWQESSGNIGYMQVNEVHAGRMAERGINIYDPHQNIQAGAVILAELLTEYPLEKALVCYNQGEAGAAGVDSSAYSRAVIERMEEYP